MINKFYVLAMLILSAGELYSRSPIEDTTVNSSIARNLQLNNKDIGKLEDKYHKLEVRIEKQINKLLSRMQKKEKKMQSMLQVKDSMAAKQLFRNSDNKYRDFQNKLKAPVTNTIPRPLQEYIPKLDSLRTAINFLAESQESGAIAKVSDGMSNLKALSHQFEQVQGRLQQAGAIKDFIKSREQQLWGGLSKYGLGGKLLGINKEVYYYQQQLSDYKSILNDQEKLEKVILGLVRKTPAFETFMQKNSYLGKLFPMPENYGAASAMDGLQTRASVGSLITERVGAGDKSKEQYLQQQVQAAQGEITRLKDKAGKGVGSDIEMPQFKPNTQRNKRFLQRIEYGANLQSQKSTYFLPVTTDMAATAGYKFNDRATAGVGLSYKLGWGSSLRNITLSNQGVGLRSYVDIKAKGSIWISGGYEYNYMQAFAKWSEISNVDIWQKSALLGIQKKYKVAKKNGNMQLLYDFLWKSQSPNGQAIKFRVGYFF